MIDPDWLPQSTRHPRGPGRPNQTDLRRSISNLYYSLIHEVCRQKADLHIGASARTRNSERYRLIYRSVDHRQAKTVFADLAKKGSPGSVAATLGQVFVDLQDARHGADYDPHARFFSAQVEAFALDVAWALPAIRASFPEKKVTLTKLIAHGGRR